METTTTRNHIIGIEVDGHGNFTYSPAMKHVEQNDTVQWQCASGPFVVLFRETSPFVDGMQAYASAGTPSDPLEVHANARGQFHYAVAVYVEDRVFIDCSCPVLVAN